MVHVRFSTPPAARLSVQGSVSQGCSRRAFKKRRRDNPQTQLFLSVIENLTRLFSACAADGKEPENRRSAADGEELNSDQQPLHALQQFWGQWSAGIDVAS